MLKDYKAKSGSISPVWTIEIQTLAEDTDRILDAVMKVHPLSFGDTKEMPVFRQLE